MSSSVIFLSVCEPSAVAVARSLIAACVDDKVSFVGIGPRDLGRRFTAWADPADLQVMGIGDALRLIHRFSCLERKIVRRCGRERPGAAVLVDFPGFHFQLAEKLNLLGIPCVQLVAPKLWAWGGWRLRRLRRDFAWLAGILPFERSFFHAKGLSYCYVGNPSWARLRDRGSVKPNSGQIALLPGSRRSEVRRHLPILNACVAYARAQQWQARFVMPLRADMADWLVTSGLELDQAVAVIRDDFDAAVASSQSVICKSGTATLECGLLGVPQVIFYRADRWTYVVARSLLRITNVSLYNIALGRAAAPERVHDIDPAELMRLAWQLADASSPERAEQLAACSELRRQFAAADGWDVFWNQLRQTAGGEPLGSAQGE